MKKNLLHFNKGIAALGLAIASFFSAQAQITTLTFSYTGAAQTFTIPPCVGTMTIDVRAAQGSAGGSSGPAGANGAAVRGVITATPGQVMYIYVGGQGSVTTGGFNGGGNGGVSPASSGGGGGGGTDIRIGGNALSNRIMVAGAGGGGGGSPTYGASAGIGGGGSTCSSPYGVGGGAAGGCAAGTAGGCSGGTATGYGTGGGGGGTGSGAPTAGSSSGTFGGAGTAGIGGDGGSYTGATYCNGGGGGGGGYYGGAGGMSGSGGCNGGGGGGSSYANNTLFSSITFTSGVQSAHGVVTMTYALNGTGVSAVPSSSYICSGSSATITGSGVVSYTWLPVGSFAGSNASTIIDNPTTTTNYTVFGTNSIGCVSNTVITINVNAAVPSLSVVNSATTSSGICPGKSATLTASGALTYAWTGGITNAVSFTPSISQTYVVNGTNACGTSSAAASISVHPLPTVGAVASTPSICSGQSVTLTGTGNASTYTWTSGVTNGAAYFPSTTNTYVVTGTSALSCTATAATAVTVVTTPSLSPTASPVLICIGSASTLSAVGATNYTWLPGNASTNSIVVSPTAAINTYTVIKSNANCVDTKTINIFVNQLPTVFAIATPTLVCAGKPSTLSAGGGQTYTWTSPSPSYTFTGANPIVSPTVTSIYTVAASDGTCVNTTTVSLSTDPNPTVNIAVSSSVICKGQSVTFTATGGNSYTWTSTSGTVFTATYSDTPLAPTMYNVTADNSFSCTTTVGQIVLVNPTPTINIAITKTLVCTGGPSTITASGAHTYVWDAGANNAITAGTIVNPTATTVYTVQGTYTTTQCQSTKTVEVKVFTPTITVTSPTNTCYGGNITLVASGANPNSYNWNTGTGFTNPFQTIAVTPTVFTIYTVSAVSGSNGVNCPSTQTTSIGIFYNPTITATPQRTLLCRGESMNLYGNGGVSYAWSNSQTGGTITINPTANTNYTVTGTDANGCVNTGTIQVKVSGCVGINELNGTVNNGLSVYPNPNNGQFTVSSDAGIKLSLVNELGQLIRKIELNAANNYKVDISDLSNGIYFVSGTKNGLQINQKIVVSH